MQKATSSADSSSFHLLSGVFLSSLVSLCADIDLMCKGLLVVNLCTRGDRSETRAKAAGSAYTRGTEALSAQDMSTAIAQLTPTDYGSSNVSVGVQL